jgi:hypothetical protein
MKQNKTFGEAGICRNGLPDIGVLAFSGKYEILNKFSGLAVY